MSNSTTTSTASNFCLRGLGCERSARTRFGHRPSRSSAVPNRPRRPRRRRATSGETQLGRRKDECAWEVLPLWTFCAATRRVPERRADGRSDVQLNYPENFHKPPGTPSLSSFQCGRHKKVRRFGPRPKSARRTANADSVRRRAVTTRATSWTLRRRHVGCSLRYDRFSRPCPRTSTPRKIVGDSWNPCRALLRTGPCAPVAHRLLLKGLDKC